MGWRCSGINSIPLSVNAELSRRETRERLISENYTHGRTFSFHSLPEAVVLKSTNCRIWRPNFFTQGFFHDFHRNRLGSLIPR